MNAPHTSLDLPVMLLRLALASGLPLFCCSCTAWLFSGIPRPDQSLPAVLIETPDGVEHGVGTVHGIVFLGRTAQQGPCRVRYALGDTVNTEDGQIFPHGGALFEARTDVKTPKVHVLGRPLNDDDKLYAMVFPQRGRPYRFRVYRAEAEGLEGDILRKPRRPLPAGAPILVDGNEDGLRLAGLVRGTAQWTPGDGREPEELVVFAGPDRLREALAVPRQIEGRPTPIYRPDDIDLLRNWREPHFTTELPPPPEEIEAGSTNPPSLLQPGAPLEALRSTTAPQRGR